MNRWIAAVLAAGAILALGGCRSSSDAGKSDYIVSIGDHRVIVAKQVAEKTVRGRTFEELRRMGVELIDYRLKEAAATTGLRVGDKVNVTPERFDGNKMVVKQSNPPQIAAEKIEALPN